MIDRLIIDHARDLFLAEGFDAVSMEQVVSATKISKGTLYARYPSKEALFAEVIEATINDWSAEASRDDHLLTDGIEQRLRQHARTIARWQSRPDVIAFQRAVLSTQTRFPELARIMHDKGYNYIVALIAKDIADAALRDGIPVRDALTVGHLLVSTINGFSVQEGGDDRESEMRAFAERIVDLIMAARAAW